MTSSPVRPTRIHLGAAAALTLACALAPALPTSAQAAKTRLTIRGAGFGHGVGMSQYGAYGFALEGASHREILSHYYSGTALGELEPGTERVLLQASLTRGAFDGATRAGGRRVSPAKRYGVRLGPAGTVDLLSPTGRRLTRVAAPLTVTGPDGVVRLRGRGMNGVTDGVYRGALEFRPSAGSGLVAVNALPLEDYVRGVVSRESPSSWPIEALKAQAVAARTYAVTTSKGGDGWDQYPDTRSQVYGGVAAETPSTDEAVADTAGEVVTYQGRPVVTYFFSTSGGRTEDVENTSLGTEPLPWLKSVDDPYDAASPKHRWGPYKWTLRTARAKLRGLVQGRFRGIQVVRRGVSPRIVEADVVGSRGRTRVSGATLRARLGLFDTWAYFTSITTGTTPKPAPDPPVGGDPTGGTPGAFTARVPRGRLTGAVLPAIAGEDVVVQRRQGGRWRRVGAAESSAGGRYAFTLERAGRYRVKYRGDAGPAVTVR